LQLSLQDFGKRLDQGIVADLMTREGSAYRIDRSGIRERDFMQGYVRDETRRRASPPPRD
jgi:hypothetical protein